MQVVYLTVGRAVYTKKSGRAIYIGFPFSDELYDKIKLLPDVYYHEEVDRWESHINSFEVLKHTFGKYDLVTNDRVFQKEIETFKETHKNILKNEKKTYQFKTKPFTHQIESFNFFMSHPRYLLGDHMGLGKTKQALDSAVSKKHEFKHTLIVCGVNGLKWNWADEIKTHTNEEYKILGVYTNTKGRVVQGGSAKKLGDLEGARDEFFIITNIESLRNEKILTKLREMCYNGVIGMTIVDEIHKVKNPSSIVGQAIHDLDSYYKMGLTGTPLIKSPEDLFNVLSWLGAETRGITKFKERYCIFGGFGGHQVIGYKNLDELNSILSKWQLRRMRTDVDLPPKVRYNVYVDLTKKQQKMYDEVRDGLLRQLDEIVLLKNPLVKLIRLRQLTSYPAILDESIGMGAKIEELKDMVEEIIDQNYKVLIFSNWTEVTDGILKELAQYKPLEITGNVPDEQRNENKNIFLADNDRNVLVGTVGVMGTGYTLHSDYVIFVDEPWDYANKEQCEKRAHRMTTTHPVTVITLLSKYTADEEIHRIVQEKKDLSDMVVDGMGVEDKKTLFRTILNISRKEEDI